MPASKTADVEHTDFKDVKESAKELGCGERWLRDGANHRGFPHHRLGKSLQFSAQDRAEIRRMHRVPARPVTRKAPRRRTAPAKQLAPAA